MRKTVYQLRCVLMTIALLLATLPCQNFRCGSIAYASPLYEAVTLAAKTDSAKRTGLFLTRLPSHAMENFQNQHQTSQSSVTNVCPATSRPITNSLCAQMPCSTHSNCVELGGKCCFNGCIFSCQVNQDTVPLIDWMTSGENSNSDNQRFDYLSEIEYEVKTGEDLIESHYRHDIAGETCTTTIDEDGTLPMECPHGYVCHVEKRGDPDHGVPDYGRCMRASKDFDDTFLYDEEEEYYS